uniref:Uncharacterized protein n=1 Tax=Arundo donax TaxID=35708 RepID=A0A0A9A5G4_ARUDO
MPTSQFMLLHSKIDIGMLIEQHWLHIVSVGAHKCASLEVKGSIQPL